MAFRDEHSENGGATQPIYIRQHCCYERDTRTITAIIIVAILIIFVDDQMLVSSTAATTMAARASRAPHRRLTDSITVGELLVVFGRNSNSLVWTKATSYSASGSDFSSIVAVYAPFVRRRKHLIAVIPLPSRQFITCSLLGSGVEEGWRTKYTIEAASMTIPLIDIDWEF